MSRRRALMMAAGGGAEIPTDSLVFCMSFRDSCVLAETGQNFDNWGQATLLYDETLGRNVGRLSEDDLRWDFSGDCNLPVGNAPFAVALKVKLREPGAGVAPLIVWGTTPYGPTVAALSWNDQGVCFSTWGINKETRRVPLPYDEWHHLCGVNDGAGNPKFYFDGVLFDTASFDFSISSGHANFDGLSFNSFWSPERAVFDLANARIYNRALSAEEVAALAKEV